MDAEERHGFEGDGFTYLKSPIWWAGIVARMCPRFLKSNLPIRLFLTWSTVIVGEVANFAAYAFAPAILVTPLGALSVLIGAVLGSYFLKEELGTLGKLGCAICLIGSVIIVLHAPPDKEIETIDQILYYAIQPGISPMNIFVEVLANCFFRVPNLLPDRRCIRCGYDISSGPKVWEEESSYLLVDLLNSWLGLRYVGEGIWNCCEVDFGGQEPVHAPIDICVHHLNCGLYFDADELFQQGPEPIPHIDVSTGNS
jgi:hypothetical protein